MEEGQRDSDFDCRERERESAGGNCNPWSKGGVPSIKAGQKSREENIMFRVTAMSCPVPAGESRVSVFIPAQVSSCDVREALAKFWSKSTLGCMRRLF